MADQWWEFDEDGTEDKIASAVTEHVLPFVTRMRARQAMVQWLTDTGVVKKKYPPAIMNLAILQGLLGEMPKGMRTPGRGTGQGNRSVACPGR